MSAARTSAERSSAEHARRDPEAGRAATPESFEALLAPVLPRAYAAARYMTGSPDDAEDLVQDAAFQAWKGFAGFETGTNFRAWFLRILTNVFYTRRRHALRRGTSVSLEEAPEAALVASSSGSVPGVGEEDPAAALLGGLGAERVRQAIEALPEEYRTVAALYFVEDLSYREIAEAVGRPIGTVRSRLHRGRRMLQAALRRLADESGITARPDRPAAVCGRPQPETIQRRRRSMDSHRTTRPRGPRAFRSVTAALAAVALLPLAACDGSASPESGPSGDGPGDAVTTGTSMAAAGPAAYVPRFTADGALILPAGDVWREWPYVGTPLTPNALNDGEAPFPEFHSVYIDPVSWEHWRKTGEFRDGTILAKELVSVYDVDAMPDGSTRQVSGRGYFMGDFAGFEIAYKSREHFPDEPGNWAYFSFGHHAPPYAASTRKLPVETCAACHQASAAEDFVFTQFYPVLRAAKAAGR